MHSPGRNVRVAPWPSQTMNERLLSFFNPRSIVLFICILQGMVFAGLLVYRGWKRRGTADYWLAALLVLLCLGNVPHFIGFAGVYDAYRDLSFFPFDNPFAVGAVIYLYVRTLTNSEGLSARRGLLLFAPALVYYAYRFLVFLQPLSFKDWFDDAVHVPVVAPVLTVAVVVSNALFLYLSITHYRRSRRRRTTFEARCLSSPTRPTLPRRFSSCARCARTGWRRLSVKRRAATSRASTATATPY